MHRADELEREEKRMKREEKDERRGDEEMRGDGEWLVKRWCSNRWPEPGLVLGWKQTRRASKIEMAEHDPDPGPDHDHGHDLLN